MTPTPLLAGRVSVVTGGASGDGPAVCTLLAAHAASVAVVDGDPVAVAAVVGQVGAGGGRAIGVVADCVGSGQIERMRREVERGLGPVDLLVALATEAPAAAPPGAVCSARGVVAGRGWPDIARGLVATFLTARVFLPGMIDRQRGTIVTAPGLGTFARQLALGLAGTGVRVVAAQSPSGRTGHDGADCRVAMAVLALAVSGPVGIQSVVASQPGANA